MAAHKKEPKTSGKAGADRAEGQGVGRIQGRRGTVSESSVKALDKAVRTYASALKSLANR